jgi:hypothetical protein
MKNNYNFTTLIFRIKLNTELIDFRFCDRSFKFLGFLSSKFKSMHIDVLTPMCDWILWRQNTISDTQL